MIQESLSSKQHIQLSSDRWHVLRARWTGNRSGEPLYERTILSEHDDRASAANAAHEMVAAFQTEMVGRTRETRDQVLVRRPGRKSLKIGKRTGAAAPGDPSSSDERDLPRDLTFGAGLDSLSEDS